jgi:dephospho-CoA kinase
MHQRPFVLGVTGNIACGKSTVLRQLSDLGAATIDADAVYHDLIVPDTPLWHALRDRFGPGIVAPDGSIDRPALGTIVFADTDALADLDRLTHPAVNAEIRRRIALESVPVVAVDAVKLIESGFDADCDQVWLVICDPGQQVTRLIDRNALSREQAERRVAAQPPIAPKRDRADVVIDNSDDLEASARQVRAAWQALPIHGRI